MYAILMVSAGTTYTAAVDRVNFTFRPVLSLGFDWCWLVSSEYTTLLLVSPYYPDIFPFSFFVD